MPIVSIVERLAVDRVVDLEATTKDDALLELCDVLARTETVGDPAGLKQAVLERERIMSTGIGLGIAVPHAKIASVSDFVLALGRSRTGIDFDALDGKPVHLVVLIAGPEARQGLYLQLLASVTLRLKQEDVRTDVLAAATAEDAIAVLARDV